MPDEEHYPQYAKQGYYTETHPDWESWVYPDGPWGWSELGTSLAPTIEDRIAHVDWYHDETEKRDG